MKINDTPYLFGTLEFLNMITIAITSAAQVMQNEKAYRKLKESTPEHLKSDVKRPQLYIPSEPIIEKNSSWLITGLALLVGLSI